MNKYRVDGQCKPPIHDDLFVALIWLSLDKLHLCRAYLRFASLIQHTHPILPVKRQLTESPGMLDVLHAVFDGHDVLSAIACYIFPSIGQQRHEHARHHENVQSTSIPI